MDFLYLCLLRLSSDSVRPRVTMAGEISVTRAKPL